MAPTAWVSCSAAFDAVVDTFIQLWQRELR